MEYRYNSTQAFLDALNAPRLACNVERTASETCEESFAGCSLEEAKRLLIDGDSDSAAKIKSEFVKIENGASGAKTMLKTNVVGCLPCVPAYLRGVPKNMLQVNRQPQKTRVIDVFLNFAYCWKITAAQVATAGAKIASAINEIEKNGVRCNLYVTNCTKNKSTGEISYISIKLKDSKSPLNLSLLAYCALNTSFLRRLVFAHKERFCQNLDANYGYSQIRKDNINIEDIINQRSSVQEIVDNIFKLAKK